MLLATMTRIETRMLTGFGPGCSARHGSPLNVRMCYPHRLLGRTTRRQLDLVSPARLTGAFQIFP